jgi:hypothetical protein
MLDVSETVNVPSDASEEEIRGRLEDWCRTKFDFDASDSRIDYGWKEEAQ